MRNLARILLLSATMLTSVSSVPQQNLYIPEEMHIKLIGGGKSYQAKISFDYMGREIVLDYNVKVNWQLLFNGDFDLTRKNGK